MNTTRIFTTLIAVSAASAAVAAPASADSIAYVKGGNAWLTPTDGSRQYQVTDTGGITHISQADDGTLLAVTAGNHLDRLDRYGNVLSDTATPVSTSGTSLFSFYGPFDADISPNGQTAAYGWWSKGFQNNSSDGTIDYEEHNGTGFTRSGALTGFTDDGYKYSRSWDGPEFIDDQTVIEGDGPGYPSAPIAIETVGSGDPKSWFADPNNMHPLEPTISRNKRVIAAVVGPDRKGIVVYRSWDAQLLGTVSACFTYSSDGADGPPAMESPTLNASGSMIAFSDGHDLWTAPIGDMTSDCAQGIGATDIAAGATSPDWGPADVPATRPPFPAHAVAAPAAPIGGAQAGGGAGAASSVRIDGPNGHVKNVLKRGVPVTVHAKPGRLTVTATAGKLVVAKRTLKVKKSGKATVTLMLSKKAAHRYRAANGLTLQITATQGAAQAQTQIKI
jgi:hypothetical protein